MAADLRFTAMGSDAHVIVVGDARLVASARARVDELEARWSRFVPSSEVSRINAASGEPVDVSEDTRTLVARAVDAWRLTGCLADCTLLSEVVAAGYDAPFTALPPHRAQTAGPAPLPRTLLGPGDIEITTTAVRLPAGLAFDPGGIGKGLAADLVADELIATGADGACVNLGGDVRVRGTGPEGAGWTIGVDHPAAAGPLALLGLTDGGVATSTVLRRRWRVGDEERHHLIDPRSGVPSTSDLALVTAVAGRAWEAEALAKAVLLRGGPHAFDILGGTGAEALAVGHDGRITASPGLRAFLGGAAVPADLLERRAAAVS